MNYIDIKYDYLAYLDEKLGQYEYCEDGGCDGNNSTSSDTKTKTYDFEMMKDYVKYLTPAHQELFLQKLNETEHVSFSKEQVFTFGLFCHLSIEQMYQLLNEIGYLVDEECPYELTYIYFFENHIYDIRLLKEALKEVDRIYGNS